MRPRTQTQRGSPPLAPAGILVVGGGESYIPLVSRCAAVYGGFSLVLLCLFAWVDA